MTQETFICYSHEDRGVTSQLVARLRDAGFENHAAIWHDGEIPTGSQYRQEIEEGIDRATIALLLISEGLLQSTFIQESEVPRLLTRSKDGLLLYPVIVEPCGWKSVDWLEELQVWDEGPLKDDIPARVTSRLLRLAKAVTELARDREAILQPRPVPYRERYAPGHHHVFVYGSLLCTQSLERTTGEVGNTPVRPENYLPIKLPGYLLTWGAVRKLHNIVDPETLHPFDRPFASLILLPKTDEESEGAVIKVSAEELDRLDIRERGYRRVDVRRQLPEWTQERLSDGPVWTYISDDAGVPGAFYVQAHYVDLVREGRRAISACAAETTWSDDLFETVPVRETTELRAAIEKRLPQAARDWASHKRFFKILTRKGLHRSGTMMRTSLIPLYTTTAFRNEVARVAEAAVQLDSACRELLLADPTLAANHFTDPWELELGRLDAGYDDHLPVVARVDLVAARDRLWVLEVNSDSPAGMAYLTGIRAAQQSEPALTAGLEMELPEHTCVSELVNAFKNRWAEFHANRGEDLPEVPNIAIVALDLDNLPARAEFTVLCNRLKEGFGEPGRAVVCDAHQLRWEDGRLRAPLDGDMIEIHLVYKRMLRASFAIDGRDASLYAEVLLPAVRSGRICFINSFRNWPGSNKAFWAIAQDPELRRRLDVPGLDDLDAFIEAHLPWTRKLDLNAEEQFSCLGTRSQQELIVRHRSRFILKPMRVYGGAGFLRGAKAENFSIVARNECSGNNYILQEEVPHPKLTIDVYDPVTQRIVREPMYSILGAYVFSGRCVAVEAKASSELPVNMEAGGYRLSVVAVDGLA